MDMRNKQNSIYCLMICSSMCM